MYVPRPTSKFPGGPKRGLNGLRGLPPGQAPSGVNPTMTVPTMQLTPNVPRHVHNELRVSRGLQGLRRRRGLGDDVPFIMSGDVAPPDPSILFGAGGVTQQQMTNAVVGAINAQVAADNANLIGPSWSTQISSWLKQTTNIAGQKISNAVIVSSGGFLVGLALISAGKGRR